MNYIEGLGEAHLIKEGPPPIYVTPDARFAVQIGKTWIKRASLKQIEKVLAARMKALDIFQEPNAIVWNRVLVEPIAAVQMAGSFIRKSDGTLHKHAYGEWYIAEPDVVAALKDIEKRRQAAEAAFIKEQRKILAKAKKVYYANFDKMRERYGKEPT